MAEKMLNMPEMATEQITKNELDQMREQALETDDIKFLLTLNMRLRDMQNNCHAQLTRAVLPGKGLIHSRLNIIEGLLLVTKTQINELSESRRFSNIFNSRFHQIAKQKLKKELYDILNKAANEASK